MLAFTELEMVNLRSLILLHGAHLYSAEQQCSMFPPNVFRRTAADVYLLACFLLDATLWSLMYIKPRG